MRKFSQWYILNPAGLQDLHLELSSWVNIYQMKYLNFCQKFHFKEIKNFFPPLEDFWNSHLWDFILTRTWICWFTKLDLSWVLSVCGVNLLSHLSYLGVFTTVPLLRAEWSSLFFLKTRVNHPHCLKTLWYDHSCW